MHFLDDYLELLDPLPEIMREKLTLMRETDLKIQAECVQLEEDASHFLSNYRLYQRQSSLSPTRSKINVHRSQPTTDATENEQQLTSEQRAAQQQKQFEYDKLVQRYQQLLKSTTAKVTLANESHEIIERYYKKLEHDLNKFKMELEADYAGLTETLEKRFASEGFNEYENSIGENSYDPSILDMEPLFDPLDDPSMNGSLTDDYTSQSTLGYLTSASQSRRFSTGLLPPSTPTSMLNRKQPQQRLLPMQSTTAAAAAAATARGRKRLQGTSSINPPNSNTKRKRSSTRNPFLNESHHPHPLHHILPPSDSDESSSTSNLPSNNNNNNNNNNPPTDYFHLNSQTSASPHLFDDDTNGGTTGDFDSSNVLTSFASGQTSTTAAIDDRRYCFCNELSYGDMIACDNPLCRREWFHYPCVGIVTPPKGKWFCAECSQMQQQHQQQQQQQQQQQSQILTTKRASTSSQ